MTDDIMRIIKNASDGIEKKANNDLKQYGITLTQCGILVYLSTLEQYTAPIKHIEKAFKVSQATMQANIQRLVKKEFITLSGDPNDKRIKNATLTSKGMATLAETQTSRVENEAYLFSEFTDDEIATLKCLLKKLNSKLD
ncbi:MarR family winged helix-turn-helix transcriptional regulator [Chakrabartyella piscis]|uniref:MarR family winged helix-turn-helix transcriptional regulator n=1 Tax=Chakrabartyella piscis TaxID=2918914 RepID=UPI00295834EB|nr:MarR family transcriptional regulator [Chakrabartyella piscis]